MSGKRAPLQSMTGFGSAEHDLFTVEIRSVNHRYLDAFFRMPHYLNKYEIELRKRLKERFARGRFEVNISVSPEKGSDIRINDAFVAGLLEALSEIKERYAVEGSVTLDLLAGFRDILVTEEPPVDDDALLKVFDEAVERLGRMREAEGDNIRKNLLEMLGTVEGHVEHIVGESAGLVTRMRDRLAKRLKDLADTAQMDEGRVMQEVAMLAERADISEELDRLKSHIKQFREIIARGGVVGRKLDFLLQEFFREANTIASKTSEHDIVSTVIDMKNEIEKLREQVQNIQ